jgi:hypothetical protein
MPQLKNVMMLVGSPKNFNMNNPEQTQCSSGIAVTPASTPKELNSFAVLMRRQYPPGCAYRPALGYSYLTPSVLEEEPVNILFTKKHHCK